MGLFLPVISILRLSAHQSPKRIRYPFLVISLFFLLLSSCKSGKPIQYSTGQNISVHSDSIVTYHKMYISDFFHDMYISDFIKPYHDSLYAKMSRPIVTLDTLFSNQYTTGNLGNLTADYMLSQGNSYLNTKPQPSASFPKNSLQYCDFAVLNNGSLRNSLSPGNISLGDIFEAMPYENILVIIQLTGAQTDSLFQHIAIKNGAYLANATCTINNYKAENIQINGSRFDSRKSYIVAINDYMAVGGDGYIICKQAKYFWNTGITVREALIQGMQNEYETNKNILPRSQPRIKLMQPSNARH